VHRSTRAAPSLAFASKADALALKASTIGADGMGEYGDIVTKYINWPPREKGSHVHGEITKLMQTVAMDDEVHVKQEGDPPNSQGVLSVAATVHWDDDEVADVMLWHHEHDPPAGNVIYWRPYDGFGKPLSYIDRSIKPSKDTPVIDLERVFRRFGTPVEQAPYKVNTMDTMANAGLNSIVFLWDASYLKDQKLAATLTFPGVLVTHLPGEVGPKPGDLCCTNHSSGHANECYFVLGTWLPINVQNISTGNMSDIVDFKSAMTVGIMTRLMALKSGGYSRKHQVLVAWHNPKAAYNRDPLEDAASKPLFLAFKRSEQQRFVSIHSPEQREWLLSQDIILDVAAASRSCELFNLLNKKAREVVLTIDAVRHVEPTKASPEAISTLASALIEQGVASAVSRIEKDTEGTTVSKAGAATHLKSFNKQCNLIAALAKMPGLLQAPKEAMRTARDKVIDMELASVRRMYTPTFKIEGEAGPSKDEVLDGGRMRKAASGAGKDESPTKDAAAQPASKKAATRRSGALLGSTPAAADQDTPTAPPASAPSSSKSGATSGRASSHTAGVSPTPLAQAAFDSVAGTPKSAPDRPFADVCAKLDAIDLKLTASTTAADLAAKLAAAELKAANLEEKLAKAGDVEEGLRRTVQTLTEEARSSNAKANERERIIQFLHSQQATVWHAFLASTNTAAAPPPIAPFPAAPE
tara:strand:+ start:9 stop:2099 length:2091 start_codon:yes stop_codon:yes gene_type:complete